MKTEKELYRDILFVTTKIQQEFPELSKYLIETPVEYSENSSNGTNKRIWEDYHHSINELLKRYSNDYTSMDYQKNK